MQEISKKSVIRALFCAPRMPYPPKNRIFRTLLAIAGWGAFFLLPLYLLAVTELIHFGSAADTLAFLRGRTPVVLFDIGLLYLIYFSLLCLFRRGWAASLVLVLFVGSVSVVNYLKFAMTGDYLYPWDIVQEAGNVGEILHFITVPFPLRNAVLLAVGLAVPLLICFSGASLPLRAAVRYPLLVCTVVCTVLSVSTPQKITEKLNRSSLYLEDMALQTSNYQANGFIGAFTVNVLSSRVQKPEDYGEDAVDALLSGYTDVPASENFSYPDIILVLSESFWDPTLLPGTTFTDAETGEACDPLANYRALCARPGAVSGSFYTTGFGGGTVRPEFEVITGLTTDRLPSGCVPWQYITEDTESYLSPYRGMGYSVMAVHPYNPRFYSRKTAYPYVGVETLCFEDDIYALGRSGDIEVGISGKQISDASFVRAMEYYLDRSGSTPVFLFGISMENHQPYPGKFGHFDILAENPAFSADIAEAVKNYTQGVYEEDMALRMLADDIDGRERDTVLIWFGDHLPTLGADFGAYLQSGMVGEFGTEDYERLYSTPFLIYANFPLGESGLVHEGKDNAIASYNLLNAAAELIGAPRSAFMQYLADYGKAVPYYNIRLHRTLTDEEKIWTDGHVLITYDRTAGGRYSLE